MDSAKNQCARIAFLESKVDMLESELSYLNEILMRCGFTDGITTLKATVEELLSEEAESTVEVRRVRKRPANE
jgi:hypothetical protein